MGFPAWAKKLTSHDYHTAAGGTAIDEEIPAIDGARLALIDFEYLAAATAHDALFMYAKDPVATPGSCRNTASALAISGQAVVNVTTAPTDPAGNAAANLDICAYQLVDGTWEFNIIQSIAASVITLTNNIVGVDASGGETAIAALGKFMIFGAIADLAYLRIHCLAATLTLRGEGRMALIHPYVGEPFYLTIDNATNAGFLNYMTMAHINK